ncbi:MAG: response regulator [Haliscomenobacteraceae bacterium CHB4]|nr:Sensor histidine kinase RcsC [Saprospiraceae bacterium]MCE7925558.1 response regulator [Haliscomenobacteraceae bacterium CHB4]
MPKGKTPSYIIVFCLLLLLPAARSDAQWLTLPFERITIEDGLPNPSALDIIQDRQGFMWFATLNGIVRYDGYRMTVYYPAAVERDSLPERDVPKMYQDKAGNIWVGLINQKAKLFRYDARSDSFIPCLFDPSKPADKQVIRNAISCLFEDNMGRLLVGTYDEGVYAIKAQKEEAGIPASVQLLEHFRRIPGDPKSLTSDQLSRSMAMDIAGNIWMTTEEGLCKFTPGKDVFASYYYSTETNPGSNFCASVCFEAPHTLWVGSASEGLFRFDLRSEKFVWQYKSQPGNPFSLADNWVNKIVCDKNGKLWLSLGSEKIDVFDPVVEKFFHVVDRRQPSNSGRFANNNTLICDYSGNIWIGTWQNGIYKFNPDKGRFHLLRPNFYQKIKQGEYPIAAVLEDKKGNLWIGTEGDGLVCWDRKTDNYRHFRHQAGNANSLSSNEIWSIVEDAEGHLWVGGSQGLDRLNPANGAVRRYRPFPEGGANVWQSKKGDIWTMTWDVGLCRLLDKKTGEFKRYYDRSLNAAGTYGLAGVVSIEEDETGKLWLGINQWGFLVLDPETDSFTHYLPEYGVHDVHFDRHGQCWLATHSGGLKIWDRSTKRLIHLPKDEHDKIGIARNILEDDGGFLWIKSPTGVVQFDPLKKRVVRQYSARNWLDNEDLWYGSKFSVPMKTRQGEMFFTSPSGVLNFHPREVSTDTVPPKIALTSLHVLDKTVLPGGDSLLKQHISQTQKIELKHWQNDFAFEFAALHFKSSEENEYAFFLENYDQNWRYAGRNRTAAYTHLGPGRYVFRVKAANSDGVWGEPISIEVIIHPPWWATWRAYLLYFLTVISIFLAIRRYELNRQRAKDEAKRLEELDTVKTRLYTNITHEFRTPLTIILGLAEQLKSQASEGMKTGLDMIRRNGQQLLRLVNQMLDLARVESGHLKLDLEQGDVVNHLQYLLESFQSLAKSKNIRLHFQTNEEKLMMDYDPERLQTVVSNLLSNAIKFTPNSGEVHLKVGQIVENHAPKLQLKISDTGPGIAEEKLPYVFDRFYQADDSPTRGAEGTGIGLTLTRELVKLMEGNISVQSVFGKGAEFTVVLPITRTAEKQAVPKARTELGHPPEPLPPEKPKAVPAEKSKEKSLILIVEDNPDVTQYLQSCLRYEHRIEVAYDGEQGIEKALELVPDLIISDVMMPRKDGFDVCHTLKTDERTSHIPIILLTAKADIESRLTGLRRGADAYLAKPFHKEELLVRIQNLLEVRRKMHAHYLALAGLKSGDGSAVAAKASPDEAMEHAFIQKVRALVEEDFSTQWQVKQLADKLFVSTSQLHRKLEALTGMHTTEFVRYIRLAKAGELLLAQPDEKISAIAYDVGFENVNEFNRRFKEMFGVSPGEWRKGG